MFDLAENFTIRKSKDGSVKVKSKLIEYLSTMFFMCVIVVIKSGVGCTKPG